MINLYFAAHDLAAISMSRWGAGRGDIDDSNTDTLFVFICDLQF